MATNVFDIIRMIRASDLRKEKESIKRRGKYLNESARRNVNFKTATPEQLSMIKNSLEKERRRALAHSLYIMIVSVLLTLIVYYIVSILFH